MRLALASLAALVVLGSAAPSLGQECPSDRLRFLPATSAELQRALDCAVPGATITLRSATVYQGNFTLPHKPAVDDGTTPKRIVIRSDALAHLPAGMRVTPAQQRFMAWLQVPAGSEDPVLATELADSGRGRRAASHYRFEGIKFFTTRWVGQLVRLGTGTETRASELPKDITFDRSYFAGARRRGTRQGLVANGNRVAVTNSYFKDFKDTHYDAQAIILWNGAWTPSLDGTAEWNPADPQQIQLLVENNHIEGSGENMMVGGGDPSIPHLVPSRIVVRGNHFFKPLAWTTETSTRTGRSYGKKWRVKNLFQLKNAEDVRIEGNVFENNWIQADQNGTAIVITPRNQEGGAPWSRVRGVTFQNNVIRNSIAGFFLLVTDDVQPSEPLANIDIHHNLLVNINDSAVPGTVAGTGGGQFLQILNPSITAASPVNLVVQRNTAFTTGEVLVTAGQKTSGVWFIDNVVRHNTCTLGGCGISGDGTAVGNDTLSAWFTAPLDVSGNILFDAGRNRTAQYPPGNSFPASVTFRSDCGSSPTIDQITGLPVGTARPDYTAVDAACTPREVGVNWTVLKPLMNRATSGTQPTSLPIN